jgi:hypothetical protein
MLGLAVALMLASFGSEGSREERFRGALLAEASAIVFGDRVATQRELDNLVAQRPGFLGCGIAMSVGGTITLVGAVSLSIMGALGVGAGMIFLIVGMICVMAGILVSLAAGLVMIGVATDQRVFDERIRVLRRQLQQPIEPPLPPPVVMAPSPVILARF